MGADEWLRHLNHRQTGVRPVLLSIPQLSAYEHRWVDTWAILNPSSTLPVWADVFRDPMQWPLRRWPWHASAWDAGAGGGAFVPGFVRKHGAVWDELVLQEHSLRDELTSCWCLKHETSSTEVPGIFYGGRCCSCGEHLSNQ